MSPEPISRRDFLRLLAAGAATGLLPPGLVPTVVRRRGPTAPTDLQPYSVQLHLHANSNHGAGTYGQSASLQWHSDWADSVGVNTLWWSEHHNIYCEGLDFVLPLDTGTLDPLTLNVTNLANPFPSNDPCGGTYRTRQPFYAQQMQATISGCTASSATLNGVELDWSCTAGFGTGSFIYAPRDDQGKLVYGPYFNKALLGQVVITLDVWRGDLSFGQKYQIEVDLAYRRILSGNQKVAVTQSIIYDLVEQPGTPTVTDQQVTIPVAVPTQGTWTSLQLQVSTDAQTWLPTGLDNTIHDIRFLIKAANWHTAEMQIRNLTFHTQEQDGPTMWNTGKGLAEGYMSTYPSLTELYGVEVAIDTTRHLNVFLPTAANQLPPQDLTARQLSNWAHGLAGLISLNHPFGAATTIIANQDQTVINTANRLLGVRVYGVDVIEIYTSKVCDLQHHLELWDILTANGYYLLGIGTSDSHGGPWEETNNTNYFVTWVWAAGPDQDSLLAGMFSRALYFGSPFRFLGATLDYSAGGVSMGGTTTVTSDATTVSVQITGDQTNWERRLRQYLIQSGTTLVNLVGTPDQPWLVFTGDTVDIDTSQSSFIRIELWDTTDGRPVAFGQTIVLLR